MASALPAVRQAAVLPVKDGRICLITSRDGSRWGVPKGSIEPGETAKRSARREAWEEAGLTGALREEAIGTYRYRKFDRTYQVTLFWMDVTHIAAKWPESGDRERRWLPCEDAASLIHRPALRELCHRAMATLMAGV